MNCKKCDRLQAEVDELWPYRKRAERAERERDEAPAVDYHAMWWKAEREREKAERERDEAKSWASRWQEEAEGNEAHGDALAADLTAAVVRAGTAEQKYEALKVAYNEQGDALVASYAHPRPLTADDITDEMVNRALSKADQWDGGLINRPVMRAVLAAALTDPPARPEWADIEDVLNAGWPEGINGAENSYVARNLHTRGVRVVTEGEN